MKLFEKERKRIIIDYKKIEEYDKPFVFILKVLGKNQNNRKYLKNEVWSVNNGREAESIRHKYKTIANKNTSYVAFYNSMDDLLSENKVKDLNMKPRIRGKNQKTKEKEEQLKLDLESKISLNQEVYTFLKIKYKTNEEIENYINELIKQDMLQKMGWK